MKTKFYVAAIGVLLLVSIGASLFLLSGGDADFAQVYSGGKRIYTVDLRLDGSYTVENGKGVNVITVKDGRIGVTDANCPDKYCVQRGFCSGGAQIVCLPNRLVIRFTGAQGIDAVAG